MSTGHHVRKPRCCIGGGELLVLGISAATAGPGIAVSGVLELPSNQFSNLKRQYINLKLELK
jgi:hypothetical protein